MDIDGDALGLIFERIDSQVSLVRAAAVCKRWRRVIADAAFLRRFRSLHAPTVAGDFHNEFRPSSSWTDAGLRRGVGPAFVPASPSVDARHFALDFLPGMVDSPQRWEILDSRGSLLLMHFRPLGSYEFFPDMTVCEPLTRQCWKIPVPASFNDTYRFLESCLIDGRTNEAGGRIGIFNFRVLCLCTRKSDFASSVAAMFTVEGDAGSFWSEKTMDQSGPVFKLMNVTGYARGFWYFHTTNGALTILDASSGEFSSTLLPPIEDWDWWQFRIWITEGRDGRLRIFILFDDNSVEVFIRMDDSRWALENSAMLSELTRGLSGYQPSFFEDTLDLLTGGPGFVILAPQSGALWFFSIRLDTMEVALVPADMGSMVYRSELPWPPVLHA